MRSRFGTAGSRQASIWRCASRASSAPPRLSSQAARDNFGLEVLDADLAAPEEAAFDGTLPRFARRTTIFLRPEDFAVPEPTLA